MTSLRRAIVDLVEPGKVDLPRHASTVYAWPTLQCSVGCHHCNFAAPPELPNDAARRVATEPDATAAYIASMGASRVSVSGGGEPLEEPLFIERFAGRIAEQGHADLEIITSGYSETLDALPRDLIAAWRAQWGASGTGRCFLLRLSVDWFHRERIGLQPAASWIRAADNDQRWPRTYVRSVLLGGDPTISILAELLGAELSPFSDYVRYLTLPSSLRVPVYYKNLIFDGRMSRRRLDRAGLRFEEPSWIETFKERFRDNQGRIIPGRLYNGPTPSQLDGLATVIEADGRLDILESTSPDMSVNIFQTSWQDALDFFYRDPITQLLLEAGTEGLVALLGRLSLPIEPRALETNQMYYVVERLLRHPDVRDRATCGALMMLEAACTGRFPGAAVDLARAQLGLRNGSLAPLL